MLGRTRYQIMEMHYYCLQRFCEHNMMLISQVILDHLTTLGTSTSKKIRSKIRFISMVL